MKCFDISENGASEVLLIVLVAGLAAFALSQAVQPSITEQNLRYQAAFQQCITKTTGTVQAVQACTKFAEGAR